MLIDAQSKTEWNPPTLTGVGYADRCPVENRMESTHTHWSGIWYIPRTEASRLSSRQERTNKCHRHVYIYIIYYIHPSTLPVSRAWIAPDILLYPVGYHGHPCPRQHSHYYATHTHTHQHSSLPHTHPSIFKVCLGSLNTRIGTSPAPVNSSLPVDSYRVQDHPISI